MRNAPFEPKDEVPYFRRNYSQLTYPLAGSPADEGFRLAQAGALHAIAAHFSRSNEPALVTMPTGSGKTAVLIGAAFLLRATRVLVITPSQLVREQIAEEFASLSVLRRIGAIGRIPGPVVFNAKLRPKSLDEWDAMREFDVVVTTPNAISPGHSGVPHPPEDLFNVVLVDEAHHSPARTWQELLEGFPSARRTLFTATPFRRDRREIKGRLVYTYELHAAHADGVYGSIAFRPVAETPELNGDAAIAQAAAAVFREDQAAGLRHLLMVRTDSMKKAKELEPLYASTGLRLPLLTSAHSLKYARRIIEQLRKDELDGIICVSMLGEGFDLPSLKLAAIHAPHKSLAATLQFIGRFARTTGNAAEHATFLAIPSEIEIESERLYEEDAAWQEIISNLSATRVAEEIETREVLDTFAPAGLLPANEEVSLFALRPAHHAKVFQASGTVDLQAEIALAKGQEIVYREFSAQHNAAIIVTRELSPAGWVTSGQFVNIIYELFILHLHEESGLLFICASQRGDGNYEHLMTQVCQAFRALSMPRLSKVLLKLNNAEFFNIGLRNRIQASGTESYRILAGSGVDQAVHASDGRLYSQGHVFGRATDGGVAITIGMSSSSRVWSSSKSRIPQLIGWCDRLAEKIKSDDIVRTNSNLDFITTGKDLEAIPADVVAADWNIESYMEPPAVVRFGNELEAPLSLLDLEIVVDRDSITSDGVRVAVWLGDTHTDFTFAARSDTYFVGSRGNPDVIVERGGQRVTLCDYLNASPLVFYTADFSSFSGSTFVPAAASDFQAFDITAIEPVDWEGESVDVTAEYDVPDKGRPQAGKLSIHTFLSAHLQKDGPDVLFYDHGSGEIADFVAMRRDGPVTRVSFYHCKGAPAAGGDRVADAYEVVGQCVKSVHWKTITILRNKIRHRQRTRPAASRFICGNLALTDELLADSQRLRLNFETVVVQPGFSRSEFSAKLGNIVAAADDYLRRSTFHPLRVLGSA
jgi:superfamily II DNA or RNA helicase